MKVWVTIAASVASASLAGCDPPRPTTEAAVAPPAAWRLSASTDAMRGSKTYMADLDSSDTFASDIVSRDRAHTELELRRDGSRFTVVMTNPNLQFMCDHILDSTVLVKFDDAKPQRFPCTESRTSDYGVAFILHEAGFVSKLRDAKDVIIEADVFQRGAIQMHFSNPGITWAKTGQFMWPGTHPADSPKTTPL